MACCPDPHCRSTVTPVTSSGEPGGEHRVASDVERLLAGLAHAAEDDVVDQGRVDPIAFNDGAQCHRSEIDRVNILEAPVASANRGTNRIDDDRTAHTRKVSGIRYQISDQARSGRCAMSGARCEDHLISGQQGIPRSSAIAT